MLNDDTVTPPTPKPPRVETNEPSAAPIEKATDVSGGESPPFGPWQFSLTWLFGLTTTVACALWISQHWGWYAAVAFVWLVCIIARNARPLKTPDEVGAAAGALAGFVLVAVHGTALQAEIYQQSLVPFNATVGGVMFAVAGLLVGWQQPDDIHPGKYALNWGAAGAILGGAIGILTAIIADSPLLGPAAAMIFAVFVRSYMGGPLPKMPIKPN